jgi:hypothetical protein
MHVAGYGRPHLGGGILRHLFDGFTDPVVVHIRVMETLGQGQAAPLILVFH